MSVDDAAPPPELLWRKNLALLVYLARSPKRARAREHLIGLLWPEKPDTAARHSLNEALRVIRRCAGEGVVETTHEQVRLPAKAVALDTERLEALAAAGAWREGAALVAGEFLEGFGVPGAESFEHWLTAERLHWRQRSVDVLVRHAEELLGGGDATEAVAVARRALALEPGSDRAVRAALRGLALAGDRAGALEQFEGFAARLAEDIGTRPDSETAALAERIRAQRGAPVAKTVARPTGESRRAPLIDRGAHLEPLVAAWEDCRVRPRAAVGLVAGDPGTGKTRLADEVGARARLDGAAVAVVRAVEADMSEPWSGVLALARGGLLDAPGIAAASAGALAAFAGRLPEWADRFPRAAREPAPESPGRALSEVLRAAAGERPVALVLDDAHWLDGDSLRAVAAAARDLAAAPAFVLLTLSPHHPRPELDELQSRIGRDLAGAVVRLGPLTAEGMRTLAHWALPAYGDADLERVVRRVATDSASLPLLAVELLHAVALGLDLHAVRGAWPEPFRTLDDSLPGNLPDAVVGAIRVGFRRLSPSAQRALVAAAVVGDRVTSSLLGRATGLTPQEVVDALDELEWQRWLAAEARGYTFVARIVRRVIARDMVTPGQRARFLEAAGRPA